LGRKTLIFISGLGTFMRSDTLLQGRGIENPGPRIKAGALPISGGATEVPEIADCCWRFFCLAEVTPSIRRKAVPGNYAVIAGWIEGTQGRQTDWRRLEPSLTSLGSVNSFYCGQWRVTGVGTGKWARPTALPHFPGI